MLLKSHSEKTLQLATLLPTVFARKGNKKLSEQKLFQTSRYKTKKYKPYIWKRLGGVTVFLVKTRILRKTEKKI